MPPKKKNAEPEVPEIPEEPPEEEDLAEYAPPEPSRILQDLGWEVVTMPASGKRFYYSPTRHETRLRPPYHQILGLPESEYRTLEKADLWTAFFARRAEFKKELENGALSEELKNPDDKYDWDLVMEAFNVLNCNEARAEYIEQNLATHAKEQLVGLRVEHEVRVRREPYDALKAAEAFAEASPNLTEDVRASSENKNLRRLFQALRREDVPGDLKERAKQVFGTIVQKCTRLNMLDFVLRELALDLPMLVDVAQQLAKVLPQDEDGKKNFVRSGGLQRLCDVQASLVQEAEAQKTDLPELSSSIGEILAIYPSDCLEARPLDAEAVLRAMQESS